MIRWMANTSLGAKCRPILHGYGHRSVSQLCSSDPRSHLVDRLPVLRPQVCIPPSAILVQHALLAQHHIISSRVPPARFWLLSKAYSEAMSRTPPVSWTTSSFPFVDAFQVSPSPPLVHMAILQCSYHCASLSRTFAPGNYGNGQGGLML